MVPKKAPNTIRVRIPLYRIYKWWSFLNFLAFVTFAVLFGWAFHGWKLAERCSREVNNLVFKKVCESTDYFCYSNEGMVYQGNDTNHVCHTHWVSTSTQSPGRRLHFWGHFLGGAARTETPKTYAAPWMKTAWLYSQSSYAAMNKNFEDAISAVTLASQKCNITSTQIKPVISSRDERAVVWVDNDNSCILAFKGSDANNILTDIDVELTTPSPSFPLCEGEMHKGFYMAYKGLRSGVRSALNSCDTVTITGHSLGGALAAIAACDLVQDFNVIKMATFGSPRVFSHSAAHHFHEHVVPKIGQGEYHRFVHRHDPVPMIPFHDPYQHVGTENWLDNKDEPLQITETCSFDRAPYPCHRGVEFHIDDHKTYFNLKHPCDPPYSS